MTASVAKPALQLGTLVGEVVAPSSNKPDEKSKPEENSKNAANAQYSTPIAHHPPGNPGNCQNIVVGSPSAVDAHLSNHPGDHIGTCP
jgi:hypothetical protein